MWDSDDLPPTLRDFKRFSTLIVPSEHNRKLFKRYFKGRIELCPLFADTTFSHLPPVRPFGFICVARDDNTNNRKDTDRLPALFTKAFPYQSDVFLTVKMSPYCKKRWTYDKRVNLLYSEQTKAEYDAMLVKHHCGIFLSGAEAWNLPACELAAMGRPSILIPLNGPAMFTTPITSWHLPYSMVKSPKPVYGGIGRIGRASDSGIIQAMQEAYSDQLLLAEKAIASARASHEFTEARFAQRLRDIVRKYA
jgi:glycosyltransferase involved in cell wall biosynthesis